MNYYGIIPARYASVRFPGKPLAKIGEKPMVQHVYERAVKAPLKQVIIATEDERVLNAAQNFGAQAVMTQPKHLSGTDRCHEAAEILKLKDNDVVVNIQGDEPFIRPDEIRALTFLFTDAEVQIATLIKKLTSPEDIANPNIVKVVTDISGKALYFSRFPIPYLRHPKADNPVSFYKHIGIYAYRMKTLRQLAHLKPSGLEIAEGLEQLRWLENAFKIHTAICDYESVAVDTPEDLIKAQSFLKSLKY